MGKVYKSIGELVGNTPLLELVNYEKNNNLKGKVYGKLEYFNPSGSVKDRAALNMIETAENEGKLKKGDTIIENTSGNTGIALAAFAASKGYKLEVFLENGASKEREQVLEAYGAKLNHYTDLPGMKAMLEANDVHLDKFLEEIYEYADELGDAYFINQVINEANPQAHIKGTGPEIWEALEGKVDAIVAMSGTGGTLAGLGTYLREKNPDVHIVGVQAAPESRIGLLNPDANVIDGVAPFANIPDAAKPVFLKDDSYDEVIEVVTEDAWVVARELAQKEGIFIGTSAAAAAWAAIEVAKRDEFKDKNIVAIFPDDGYKYLSTGMYK